VDFELDEDQHALQEAVRDLVDGECPPSLVRAVVEGRDDGNGFWKSLVEADWPGLTVPDDAGGTGASAVELVIALEELGRGADPTPFLATTSQYVPLVRGCVDLGERSTLLAAVAAGGTGAAVYEGIEASRTDDGWSLRGTATEVIDGDRADELAVVVGDDVFVVPAASCSIARRTTFDESFHLAEVTVDGVVVPDGRAAVGVAPAVHRARCEALAGLAATMVGASQRILELVLAHIKDRHQFGVPIGSFQAVKHMAVDAFVSIQRARALHQYAALTVAEDDPRMGTAASMAKAAAGDCQRLVGKHGVQLFGGLGFTWENDLQLYLRRAKVGEPLLGSSSVHRAQVGRDVIATGLQGVSA
jgi:alkylation response protein AidB-like acyl-CoA dehydrogenase